MTETKITKIIEIKKLIANSDLTESEKWQLWAGIKKMVLGFTGGKK